jgi:hypothetical protein
MPNHTRSRPLGTSPTLIPTQGFLQVTSHLGFVIPTDAEPTCAHRSGGRRSIPEVPPRPASGAHPAHHNHPTNTNTEPITGQDHYHHQGTGSLSPPETPRWLKRAARKTAPDPDRRTEQPQTRAGKQARNSHQPKPRSSPKRKAKRTPLGLRPPVTTLRATTDNNGDRNRTCGQPSRLWTTARGTPDFNATNNHRQKRAAQGPIP